MDLAVRDVDGQRFLEGPATQPLIKRVEDVTRVLEAGFEHGTRRLLLYHENLTTHFFDLSSGEAGEILQKLRTYQIRLAIVSLPTLHKSHRFGELLADEQRGPYFRVFDDRASAQAWLCSE